MRFEFHPEALAEYSADAVYYAERQPGLEAHFVESIEETINRILEAPDRWPILEEDVRRCLAHVFPYGILYTVEPDHVFILAVMNCSREPGYWRRRKN